MSRAPSNRLPVILRPEPSPYYLRRKAMSTISRLAAACAEEISDPASPLSPFSIQEANVAVREGIVFG